MTNQSALLEGEDDESLSAEAADIASQMSFQVSRLHVCRYMCASLGGLLELTDTI